tara:strand:- start:508 stop:1290 length:783 start_codon:yes stop_codon:yes gene_type:complete
MEFSDTQVERYARHIILKEIGGAGQKRLLSSRVLVVGAGGLGSPLLLYLAAAGVGTIGIVDDDTVSLSNLQRQVVHTTDRLGVPKTESALATISGINPDVRIVPHGFRLVEDNVLSLISEYDVIADGSDNFATRFLVNDACYFGKKTLVSGALLGFDGQLSTYKAYLGGENPCYRCLFDQPETEGSTSCAEAGVLGALAGAIGSFQAVEVVKELLDLGESLSGALLIFDALGATFRKVRVNRDLACRLCGDNPDIKDLSR